MRKQRVVQVVLALMCLFSLLVIVSACGGPGEDPQTVADHYYSALKSGNYNTAIKYLHVSGMLNPSMNVTTAGELQTQEQSAQSMYGGPIESYKINSQSVNGQDASVNVTVTRHGGLLALGPYTMDLQLSQINGEWVITGAGAPGYLY